MSFVNAASAYTWIETHEASLILLDIMLPDMDGFAFMKKLRHQFDIPVIIMSARSEKSDQLLGFELGADDISQNQLILISCVPKFMQSRREQHILHIKIKSYPMISKLISQLISLI